MRLQRYKQQFIFAIHFLYHIKNIHVLQSFVFLFRKKDRPKAVFPIQLINFLKGL